MMYDSQMPPLRSLPYPPPYSLYPQKKNKNKYQEPEKENQNSPPSVQDSSAMLNESKDEIQFYIYT